MNDIYRLTDEHDAIRAAVRALSTHEIQPHAADVDERARYPEEALKALVRSGFHATHIPEDYDGPGADGVSTCIVIEEVARVCATSSLIPAVNKLGSVPLLLSASPELKAQVLPSIASGEAAISYALSEREAGSDAAAMTTRARRDGEHWVLNGTKAWITNAGISQWYTVMAVTDPDKGPNGISAFVVHAQDPGFEVGTKERKLGIKGSPTGSPVLEDVRVPHENIIGVEGKGLSVALGTLMRTRLAAAAQAVGIGIHAQRLWAFTLSGALCGFAGGLYVHMLGSITTEQVYLELTFVTLAMLVVGGLTSLWGAVLGALAVSGLDSLLGKAEEGSLGPDLPTGSRLVVVGAVMALVLILRPSGLTGGRELSLRRGPA